MVSHNPLISVLVCNYNYGKFVKEALDSILAQSYSNIEVVVVDDGSIDDSVKVLDDYISEHREFDIRLKAMKSNRGICFSRNEAIDASKGEYFLFLDSDDTIPPNYVATMYKTLTSRHVDVVYGDVKGFGSEEYVTKYPEFDFKELIKHNYINVTSLVKRDSIGNHRFDVKLNRKTHEDYDFWLGLSLKGLKFAKAKDTYLNYRIQNTSRNANEKNMKERVQEIASIWRYCFTKYHEQYPAKLTQAAIFDFYDYQIAKVGNELVALNNVVQNELVPELKRREVHINYLSNKSVPEIIREKVKHKISRRRTDR